MCRFCNDLICPLLFSSLYFSPSCLTHLLVFCFVFALCSNRPYILSCRLWAKLVSPSLLTLTTQLVGSSSPPVKQRIYATYEQKLQEWHLELVKLIQRKGDERRESQAQHETRRATKQPPNRTLRDLPDHLRIRGDSSLSVLPSMHLHVL